MFSRKYDNIPLNLEQTLWFMHDKYPADFNINVLYTIDVAFEGHWIGKGPEKGPPACPASQPSEIFIEYAFSIETREQLWARAQQACNEFEYNRNCQKDEGDEWSYFPFSILTVI